MNQQLTSNPKVVPRTQSKCARNRFSLTATAPQLVAFHSPTFGHRLSAMKFTAFGINLKLLWRATNLPVFINLNVATVTPDSAGWLV